MSHLSWRGQRAHRNPGLAWGPPTSRASLKMRTAAAPLAGSCVPVCGGAPLSLLTASPRGDQAAVPRAGRRAGARRWAVVVRNIPGAPEASVLHERPREGTPPPQGAPTPASVNVVV